MTAAPAAFAVSIDPAEADQGGKCFRVLCDEISQATAAMLPQPGAPFEVRITSVDGLTLVEAQTEAERVLFLDPRTMLWV